MVKANGPAIEKALMSGAMCQCQSLPAGGLPYHTRRPVAGGLPSVL